MLSGGPAALIKPYSFGHSHSYSGGTSHETKCMVVHIGRDFQKKRGKDRTMWKRKQGWSMYQELVLYQEL